jgi:outer membrane protein assembly factor BamB
MRVSHLLAVAILLLGLAPQLIEPPFVRKWTQLAGDQAFLVAVRDGLVYYGSQKGLGALDLATGKRRWSSLSNQWITTAGIMGRTLYAISQTGKTSALVAIDIDSWRPRTLARLAPDTRHLAVDPGHLYVLDGSGTLRAYDPSSGAVIWSRPLQSGKSRGVTLAQLESTSDGLYVGLDDAGEFGVDPKDGRILWSRPSQYAGLYPPILIGGDVITQNDALRRTTVRTGKVVWKAEAGYGDAVLVANVLISSSQKGLLGRDVTDGRVLWRRSLRDPDVAYDGGASTISDGENVWILRRPVLCITKDGRERWNWPEPFTGTPGYADHEWAVTTDGERILGYGRGTLPPLPTSDPEKRSLAGRLASEFEILDDAERGQLGKLAPFAFRPLLARYVGWAKAYDANPENENSSPLYRLMTDAIPLLHTTCRREDTGAIVTALSSLETKSSWREELEQILQSKGDPAGFVPVLVRNLRRLPQNERQESAALAAVSHSSHPEAVSFMLAALHDPRAAEAWHREAFRHLAGTGGTLGVRAVRAARPRRGPRKPWFDRIDFSQLERDGSLDRKTDARGHTWMLFHSGVLGNYSDLFVVRKLGSAPLNRGRPGESRRSTYDDRREGSQPLPMGAWIPYDH